MRNFKKRALIQFLAVTVILCLHSVCYASMQCYVSYSVEDEVVNIRGVGEKLSELPVIIIPYDKNEENISDLTDDQILAHMLFTDKNGNFNEEIGYRTTWNNGLYKAVITSGDNNFVSWFVFADENDVNTILSDIDGKSISQIASTLNTTGNTIGLVDSYSSAYVNDISNYLYYNRPANGYNADTFLKNYVSGLALTSVKSGNETLENAICKFAGYTDVDINDFLSYSSVIRQEAGEDLRKLVTSDDSFKTAYEKGLLLAKINNAETSNELQKAIIENCNMLGLDLSEYNRLTNDYSRSQVFSRLVGKKYNNFTDIKSAFDEACGYVSNLSKQSSGSPGSGAGLGNGTGAIGNVSFDSSMISPQKTFSDMNSHWAKSVVERLAGLGIISGYPDGSFAPDGIITRAEFSKMICSALGIKISSYNGEFLDVMASDWFSGYIAALYQKEIICGSEGKFVPNSPIMRQDAAVIVWRSIVQRGKDGSSFFESYFYDISDVSDYAKDSVGALSGLGIINGYEGLFNPLNHLTRAEAAQIVKGLIDVPGINIGR